MQQSSSSSVKRKTIGTVTSNHSIRSNKIETPEKSSSNVKVSRTSTSSSVRKAFNKKHPCVRTSSPQELEQLYQNLVLSTNPLFPTVVGDDGSTGSTRRSIDTSILVTGFGLRNLKSLQDALEEDEAKKMEELYMTRSKESSTSDVRVKSSSASREQSEYYGSDLKQSEVTSQTEATSSESLTSRESSRPKKRLEYLMGLKPEDEGEIEDLYDEKGRLAGIIYEDDKGEEEETTGTTAAMKQAQKYLKSHKIFEFFQFLIAHMLSHLPDNPIEYLLQLLDKCLVYRSGFGEPPLLYTPRHIEELFYLMDPMKTGFIEQQQYNTGMLTLGICSYNKQPPITLDGTVSKMAFEDEAYEHLTDMLNEMIRRRWIGNPPPVTPPPTPQIFSVGSSTTDEGFYLQCNKI